MCLTYLNFPQFFYSCSVSLPICQCANFASWFYFICWKVGNFQKYAHFYKQIQVFKCILLKMNHTCYFGVINIRSGYFLWVFKIVRTCSHCIQNLFIFKRLWNNFQLHLKVIKVYFNVKVTFITYFTVHCISREYRQSSKCLQLFDHVSANRL